VSNQARINQIESTIQQFPKPNQSSSKLNQPSNYFPKTYNKQCIRSEFHLTRLDLTNQQATTGTEVPPKEEVVFLF